MCISVSKKTSNYVFYILILRSCKSHVWNCGCKKIKCIGKGFLKFALVTHELISIDCYVYQIAITIRPKIAGKTRIKLRSFYRETCKFKDFLFFQKIRLGCFHFESSWNDQFNRLLHHVQSCQWHVHAIELFVRGAIWKWLLEENGQICFYAQSMNVISIIREEQHTETIERNNWIGFRK